MIVECTVCDQEMEKDVAAFTLAVDEENPLYFCSERCLQSFEENPELFDADVMLEEARWESA